MLYVPIGQSKKCERCELQYSDDEKVCPHCLGLNDTEIAKLKNKHQNQLKENKSFIPFVLAMLLVLFLILIWVLV